MPFAGSGAQLGRSRAQQSAEYIFGDATGDPVADTLLVGLRKVPSGINRTEMHALLSGNMSGARIDQALAVLERQGYAKPISARSGQRGRPSVVWRVV
jgi:hypothetical protein